MSQDPRAQVRDLIADKLRSYLSTADDHPDAGRDLPVYTDRPATPAPIPPAKLWRSPVHTTDVEPDGYGWPRFADAALLAAYELGVAAGRTATAAEVAEDIAQAIETSQPRGDLTAIQCARTARHHATQYGTEETP